MSRFMQSTLILGFAFAAAAQSQAATDLDIYIDQACPVVAGDQWTVDFQVKARLTGNATLGLAGIVFDLSATEDGGAFDVSAVTIGVPAHMDPFATTAGITGVNGFGGTPVGVDLQQIGGAQNTIGHTTTPPNGSVTTLLGVGGYTVVATFTLVLPTAGSDPYTVTLSNIRATVIDAGQSAAPYKTTAVAPMCNSITHPVGECGACEFTASSGPGSCYITNEANCEALLFVCDVGTNCACSPGGVSPCGTTCFADCDGNGDVNAGDRGQISANIGQTAYRMLCQFDLDGNGAINAADRGQVSTNVGLCTTPPDWQNGSGVTSSPHICGGGGPFPCSDTRFSTGTYQGDGTSCSSGTTCP